MISAAAQKLVTEARRKGMWIYDPKYKWWYSPAEFEHIAHYTNKDDVECKTLLLKDPREGIDAGFKRLTQVEEKLQIFIKKVTDYYKK